MMYNSPYFAGYNNQQTLDRVNAQMVELEKIKQQLQQPQQQPTNLTQNFQIAPTNHDVIKYANNIDEVTRSMVVGDTPYFSRDMSIVWIKNTKGDIKSYELNEIIPKDEKDLKIEYLEAQIESLKKGMVKNESNDDVDGSNTKSVKDEKPAIVSAVSKSKTKSE